MRNASPTFRVFLCRRTVWRAALPHALLTVCLLLGVLSGMGGCGSSDEGAESEVTEVVEPTASPEPVVEPLTESTTDAGPGTASPGDVVTPQADSEGAAETREEGEDLDPLVVERARVAMAEQMEGAAVLMARADTEAGSEAAPETLQQAHAHMEAAERAGEDHEAARAEYENAAKLYGEVLDKVEARARAVEEADVARKAAEAMRGKLTDAQRELAKVEALAADTAWTAAENAPDDPVQMKTLYDLARAEYEKVLTEAEGRKLDAVTPEALERARALAGEARKQVGESAREVASALVAEGDAAWSEAGAAEASDAAKAKALYEQARDKYAKAVATAKDSQRRELVDELRSRGVVVSAAGDGRYKTIMEAVNAVEPNTPILIKPGLYKEAIVLDKPLVLIGDGPAGDILIESVDADCITVKTDKVVVHGLTLRSSSGQQKKGVYTVYCGQGRMVLEYCDISSDSLSAVAVYGADTNPVIRGCKIHGSSEAGVFVYSDAKGTIENCEITRNQLAGVQIKSGANPLVRRCKINRNQGSGVFVNDDGLGAVESCEITGNGMAGISIAKGGNPAIRDCRINNNAKYGIRVYDGGRGSIEESNLTGNIPEACLVESGSELLQTGNKG